MSGIRIRAVLFDLDGTLVDSAPDIAAAMNRALEELHLRTLSLAEIAARIGKGPRVLAQRVLAVQPGLLDEAARDRLLEPLLSTYLDHYNTTIGNHGRLFPHVAETLRTLRARGLKLAVVTNALQLPAQSILERYGIADAIDLLLGGDRVINRKPHPEALETACRWLGVDVDEAIMVGDSNNDVAAARAAGCEIVCVPYGYNEGRSVAALDCDVVEDFAFLPGWIAAHESRALALCREDTH
ncbi:phosphoglycolate phosphatase [Rudaea sp.]|uniref:phosphoglycolate phosphatase n=1 Tax=Rudaea sp. TaxID=2136325 RepID=UPI002ED4618A